MEGKGVGGSVEAIGLGLAAAVVEGKGHRRIDHGAEVAEDMGRGRRIAREAGSFHAFAIDVALETREFEVESHGGEGVHRDFVAVCKQDP